MYLNVPNDDWGTSSKSGQALDQDSTHYQKGDAAHQRSLQPNVPPSSGVEGGRGSGGLVP